MSTPKRPATYRRVPAPAPAAGSQPGNSSGPRPAAGSQPGSSSSGPRPSAGSQSGSSSSSGPRPAAPAASPVKLRKPVFTTVDKLQPATHGHNLTVRVLSARTVLDKPLSSQPGRAKVAECLVGDHTGTVLFSARNQQIEMMKPGNTVIFRNARIDMFKGTMRLAVDKWGLIEVVQDPSGFQVNEANNVSKLEFELVDVPPKNAPPNKANNTPSPQGKGKPDKAKAPAPPEEGRH